MLYSGGIEITAALLATRAENRNGLLYIEGGAWEYVTASAFPCPLTGFFAAVAEPDPSEIGSLPVVHLAIRDSAGQVLGSEGSTIVNLMRDEVRPDAPVRVPLAIPFMGVAHKPEPAAAVLTSEQGDELARVPFLVKQDDPDRPG